MIKEETLEELVKQMTIANKNALVMIEQFTNIINRDSNKVAGFQFEIEGSKLKSLMSNKIRELKEITSSKDIVMSITLEATKALKKQELDTLLIVYELIDLRKIYILNKEEIISLSNKFGM